MTTFSGDRLKKLSKIAETLMFVVEIPMFGVNKSLNVVVSLGIVLFKAMEKNKSH